MTTDIGKRMDFDIEILVRLYWTGCKNSKRRNKSHLSRTMEYHILKCLRTMYASAQCTQNYFLECYADYRYC